MINLSMNDFHPITNWLNGMQYILCYFTNQALNLCAYPGRYGNSGDDRRHRYLQKWIAKYLA